MELKKRFNFGPLEILGASYEDHRDLITIQRERSRSVIPNTVTTVTRCQQVRCGGKTWNESYKHTEVEQPWDDIQNQVTEKIPAGTKSVLLKYVMKDAGLYSVRMEANHALAAPSEPALAVRSRLRPCRRNARAPRRRGGPPRRGRVP